jgi:hypothetical protein
MDAMRQTQIEGAEVSIVAEDSLQLVHRGTAMQLQNVTEKLSI